MASRRLRHSLGRALVLGAMVLAACEPKSETTTPEPSPTTKGASAVRGPAQPWVFDDPFPSVEALAQYLDEPGPDIGEILTTSSPETWTLHGDGTDRIDIRPYDGPDPVGQAVATKLAQHPRGLSSTAGLQCFAEQFGRFALAHGSRPTSDVYGFIAARCGVASDGLMDAMRMGPASALPKSALAEDALPQHIDDALEMVPDDTRVGLWFGREGRRSAHVVVMGRPGLELREPVMLSGRTEGYVDIRGRVSFAFDHLEGLATRGATGVARCQPSPNVIVRPPQLALRCPLDGDSPTVITLFARLPGDVLGLTLLQTIASRGALPQTYTPSLPTGAAQSLAEAIADVRESAGLPAAKVSAPQSQVVAKALPHLLRLHTQRSEQGRTLALGLLAGHALDGDLHRAHLAESTANSQWSASRELAALLWSPRGRARLLDPAVDTLAIASQSDEATGARYSLVATYQSQEADTRDATLAAVFDAIDRQRAVAGLPPVVRAGGPNDRTVLDATVGQLERGQLEVHDAMTQLLGHFVEQTHRGFQGTVLDDYDFDGWQPHVEGALVTEPKVAATAAVASMRPPGAAWSRRVVLIVYTIM